MSEIYFPPVGIAHLTSHPLDLIRDRLAAARQIQVSCVTQPKSEPHVGTATLLYTTFALAAELKERMQVDVEVLLDVLENSPGAEWESDGVRYFKPLNRIMIGGKTAAEVATAPLLDICAQLTEKSRVAHRVRSYAAIQSEDAFREGLARILSERERSAAVLAPRDRRLLVRPLCPACGLGDKEARKVRWSRSEPILITSVCPDHGEHVTRVRSRDDVIDCNTPLRTVLRSYAFTASDAKHGRLTIVVNGADWAGEWMQHVYLAGLELLGVSCTGAPPNFFSPLILDRSGAKLSKTIYLRPGAYDELSPAWRSYAAFCEHYGDEGRTALWDEARRWVSEPRRFFRNYSIEYLETLLS